MITQSKYTKSFYSDDMTDLKYNQLYQLALDIRGFKNKISQEINQDILKYVDMSKFEFISLMRQKHPREISSYFEEAAYSQILQCYKNRFDAIKSKIQFKHRVFKGFTFYKRKTKDHNAGDLKGIVYESKSTDLSVCLTYLARYGNSGILEYIKSVYNVVDEKKQKFYDKILKCCEKFGFQRLLSLALRKRERILNKYTNPIEFKLLTFSGKTGGQTSIIAYNKNRHSKIAGFASINVPFQKGFDIPVKISKPYHGEIAGYKKLVDKAQYCYTLKFDTFKKRISILLCKAGDRELPEYKTSFVGIDVNVKHNLFTLSTGETYDFDRKLVDSYIKVLNQVDKLKAKNLDYEPGKRKQIKLTTFQRKIKHSNQRVISGICKSLKSHGYDHIVMENLDNSFRKSYVKNDEFGEKYNRLTHILNIGSLKDEFKHIAVKYDIAVSFVQAEYTSQMCEHCGCIDLENRSEQETFCCVECGHYMNADLHAAINIRNRASETVFQQELLKQNPDGTYIPKKISHSHSKLKDIIHRSIMAVLQEKQE